MNSVHSAGLKVQSCKKKIYTQRNNVDNNISRNGNSRDKVRWVGKVVSNHDGGSAEMQLLKNIRESESESACKRSAVQR